MEAWTGGRAVVEMLKVEGVKHVFGIVGSTFLDVLDRLYDDSSVEYINVRHSAGPRLRRSPSTGTPDS